MSIHTPVITLTGATYCSCDAWCGPRDGAWRAHIRDRQILDPSTRADPYAITLIDEGQP